jgi:hypothetical protein
MGGNNIAPKFRLGWAGFALLAQEKTLAQAWIPSNGPPSCCKSLQLSLSAESMPSSLPDTSRPLSRHTFAGMIEEELKERFDENHIGRVLTSWRLLNQEYYRKEFVGADPAEDSEDMVQECHSYLPGLTIQAFWNSQDFEWAKYLEKHYSEIRKEFGAVTENMVKLQSEGNNIWTGALTTDAASYGEGWKTLVLMDRGQWDSVNVNLFPKTAKAVHESGVPATEVFFASMVGPSKIKKHSDFTNFVLTSHLALDIPYSGENKCRLTVGGETRQWINGRCYVFDTSLLHDAINESDQIRYILMLRFWHPDLTPTERQALQFTFDCLEFPGFVSQDPGERFMAEQMAVAVRKFPILSSSSASEGFESKTKQNKKLKASGRKIGFGK